MKKKLEWNVALAMANQFSLLIHKVCERLEFAGSLRRHKPHVGDIEIVLVPRTMKQATLMDAWPSPEAQEYDLLEEWLQKLRDDEIIKRGRWWGPRHKELFFQDASFDLYIVRPPAQWGVILVIRTGPAEFSRRLVTPREYGGLMPEGFKFQNGALWRDGQIVDTPEEEDVFRALGLEWIEPDDRR
jgi:DNA polymerase/3'-5' exonuclease PolX